MKFSWARRRSSKVSDMISSGGIDMSMVKVLDGPGAGGRGVDGVDESGLHVSRGRKRGPGQLR